MLDGIKAVFIVYNQIAVHRSCLKSIRVSLLLFGHMMRHTVSFALSFLALTQAKTQTNRSDYAVMIQSGISAAKQMCLTVGGGWLSVIKWTEYVNLLFLIRPGHI